MNDRLAIYDTNNDGKVTLEEYQDRHYGTVEGEVDVSGKSSERVIISLPHCPDENEIYDRNRQLTFKQSKSRDHRRFSVSPFQTMLSIAHLGHFLLLYI